MPQSAANPAQRFDAAASQTAVDKNAIFEQAVKQPKPHSFVEEQLEDMCIDAIGVHKRIITSKQGAPNPDDIKQCMERGAETAFFAAVKDLHQHALLPDSYDRVLKTLDPTYYRKMKVVGPGLR